MKPCAWCKGPISADARRDAITCSQRCRQARNRVHRYAVAGRDMSRGPDPSRPARAPRDGSRETSCADPSRLDRGLQARRFAYADPPYPGKAHYYRDHPDYAGEVDHDALIRRLSTYDGWALSTSASALPDVLALTVAQGLAVRVAAWIRGPRPHTTARYPLNGWEPVIYVPVASDVAGAVAPLGDERDGSHAPGAVASAGAGDASRVATGDASRGAGPARRVDTLTHGVSPMLTLPGRVIGAKPAAFCRWMFDLIGATPCDELDDLFPGSGMVGRTWDAYRAKPSRVDAALPYDGSSE